MLRLKKSLVAAAVILPVLCLSAFGQRPGRPVGGPAAQPVGGPAAVEVGRGGGGGNAIAAYVFGEENSANAEELAEAIVNTLSASRNYSPPRRGAREFFRAADRMQARNRGRLLDDSDFCRIGGDEGVQFLCIIDIQKAGRGNSVWARIIDLDRCRLVATAEYTGLIRNPQEISRAANEMSSELLHRRIGTRSIGGGVMAKAQAAPPPPPRGNQIAAYVYGIDEAKLGEDLSVAIVDGLVNNRQYSQPRRGARGFFAAADRAQARNRGRLLDDRDFCKIGTDYEIEYLCIIDIEKAGRGASVWARIIDLETCRIIATGERQGLIRNDGEVQAAANEIVRELLHRRVGNRSIRR